LFFLLILLICGTLGALIINPDLAYLAPGDAAQKFYEMASGMRASLTGLFTDGGSLAGVRRFAEPYLSRVGLNVETILVGLGLLLLTIACIRILSVTSSPEEDYQAEETFGPVPESPGDRPSSNPYWPYDRRPRRAQEFAPVSISVQADFPAPAAEVHTGVPVAPEEVGVAPGRFAFAEATTGDAWLGGAEVAPAEAPEMAPAPSLTSPGTIDLAEPIQEIQADVSARFPAAPAATPAHDLAAAGGPGAGGSLDDASGSLGHAPAPAGDHMVVVATSPPQPGPRTPSATTAPPGAYELPAYNQVAAAATGGAPYLGHPEEEVHTAPQRPTPAYSGYQPGRPAAVSPVPAMDEGFDELPPAQFPRPSFQPEGSHRFHGPASPRPTAREAWVTGRPELGSGLRKFTLPGLLLLALGAGGAYGLQTPYAAVITSSPYAGILLAGAAGLLGTITATWFAAGPMKPVARRIALSTAGVSGGPDRGSPPGTVARPIKASGLAPALAPVPRRSGAEDGLESPDSIDWGGVPKPSVFVPWSQNTTSLGVDIGSAWMKVVQLNASQNSLEIMNIGLCSTPDGAVTENGVENPEDLGAALQKLLGDRNIIQRRTVSAIGGQGVIIRHVQFPVMAPEELREVVRWEAEHHIPIPPGEAVIDFTVLPGQGDADERGNRQMRVMLVGAQRAMVNAHVESLKAAKLLPDGLDVEALASFRVVTSSGYFAEDAARYAQAIIDLGHTTTKLSIYLRDSLEMSRALPVGGHTFTRVLSEDLRVSEMEAEILKRQYGVRADGGRVLQALAPTFQDLLFEIRRSFEFFSSRHFGQSVRHVHLIGGGARMPGLTDAMSRYLNLALGERVPEGASVRVNLVDPLNAISLSPRLTQRMGLIGPEFVTALGLALGGQEILHAS
jgi:type IV pilus assembly protein PilM